MVLSCIQKGAVCALFISYSLFCNEIEYCFDGRLSTKTQETIKNNIQAFLEQKKNAATIIKTITTQYPCVQSVTIEHLPENKDQVHIRSVQPHITMCVGQQQYLVDTQGTCISPDHFMQEEVSHLPVAYTAKKNIVDNWDTHIAHAILYFKVARPDSRIEIDNAHAIRVQPNTGAVIISDAYQLPTPEQLAVCDQCTEHHKNLPASHLKKCKQLTFDTRFDKQIIQRCLFTGAPHHAIALATVDGVNIGGTGHGSHTT